MNNGAVFGLSVGAGLIIGSGVTFVVCKKVITDRCEAIKEEEIQSIKQYYKDAAKKYEEDAKIEAYEAMQNTHVVRPNPEELVKTNIEKPDITQYRSIAKKYFNTEGPEEETKQIQFEVIDEDKYGEHDDEDYTSEELYLYSDGIIATANGEIIHDPENVVGTEFKDHFDDEGYAYVRNLTDKIDICVVQSAKEYSEDWPVED